MQRGTVIDFDEGKGLGVICADDGSEWPFQVVEVADGSRTIDVGQVVGFEPLPKFGRLEARRIHKL